MNLEQKRLAHCLTRDDSRHYLDDFKLQEDIHKQKTNRFAKRINSQPSADPIVNVDFRLKTFYKPNKQYKFTGSCFRNDFGRTTKLNSMHQKYENQTKNNHFIFKKPAPTLQSKFIVDVKTDLMKNKGKTKIFTRSNRIKTIPNLINIEDYLTQKKVQYRRQMECQFIRTGEAYLMPLIQEKKGKIYIRALHKIYEKQLKIATKCQGQIFFHPNGQPFKKRQARKKKNKILISRTLQSSPSLKNKPSESIDKLSKNSSSLHISQNI